MPTRPATPRVLPSDRMTRSGRSTSTRRCSPTALWPACTVGSSWGRGYRTGLGIGVTAWPQAAGCRCCRGGWTVPVILWVAKPSKSRCCRYTMTLALRCLAVPSCAPTGCRPCGWGGRQGMQKGDLLVAARSVVAGYKMASASAHDPHARYALSTSAHPASPRGRHQRLQRGGGRSTQISLAGQPMLTWRVRPLLSATHSMRHGWLTQGWIHSRYHP